MDREWLAARLAAGKSIAAIATESGKGASTVAYWINKHGLVAVGRAKHQANGPVDEVRLRELVQAGASIREIGAALGLSYTAARHQLRRFGLQTQPSNYRRRGGAEAVVRECPTHGWTIFQPTGNAGYLRCGACNVDRVVTRRRRTKEILVAEAGGCCVICGYDRLRRTLQFHHLDPSTKSFEIGGRGLTLRLDVLRAEAQKCVLLCANCHVEVEEGITQLPSPTAPADD